MSENKVELKQCTRCHSTCTLDYFEKNRKGEYFNTCNKCRTKNTEYQKQQRAKLDPTISKCPACSYEILNRNMENHQRKFPCHLTRSLLKHNKRLRRYEWLYDNDGTVLPEDQEIIDDLKMKNSTVYNCGLFSVAWTEEELSNGLDKHPGRKNDYEYCWKFNDGYSNCVNK